MDKKDLPEDVLDTLLRGSKIEAIKRLRAARGLGLKEAKDLVEERLENLGNAEPARPQDAKKGRRKSGLKALIIAGLILIFIVWAMVNIPRLAGNVIVLMNRGGYDKIIFMIHDVFYDDDAESGLLWGFHGSLPDGVTLRMCAPELAPVKSLGFRGLERRFPEGTRLEVWYNPGVTATLFQHRTLNIIPHTADLVHSEMKGIWWWLGYCLVPLLAVLIYASMRGKG